MFDHDNSANIWRGGAIRNARIAEDNAADARAARANTAKFEEAMHHNYKAAMDAQGALKMAQARIAELEDKLAIKTAAAAGFEAQSIAYRDQHPDSPLRADSGKRYKDGEIKRRIRIIYEAAFDAALRQLSISNPVSRRAN